VGRSSYYVLGRGIVVAGGSVTAIEWWLKVGTKLGLVDPNMAIHRRLGCVDAEAR
jgi:hypothetical protein